VTVKMLRNPNNREFIQELNDKTVSFYLIPFDESYMAMKEA